MQLDKQTVRVRLIAAWLLFLAVCMLLLTCE